MVLGKIDNSFWLAAVVAEIQEQVRVLGSFLINNIIKIIKL